MNNSNESFKSLSVECVNLIVDFYIFINGVK